jgi:hypothetical protein
MSLAPWYTDQDYPNRLMLLAAEQSIGPTHSPIDATRAAMVLRGTGNHPAVLRMILDKRAAWLDWHTMTQARWMDKISRRPGRNRKGIDPRSRHYPDAILARESYVRCHDGEPSLRTF